MSSKKAIFYLQNILLDENVKESSFNRNNSANVKTRINYNWIKR